MRVRLKRIAVIVACMLLASASAYAQRSSDVECTPENLEAAREHYKRAEAFKTLQRYSEAVQEYFRAYKICPRALLVFNAAQAYWLDGKKAEALDLYERYLKLAPQGAGASVAYERICDEAEALLHEQDYDTALRYYQRCAEHEPTSERAERARERIAEIVSAREKARREAEQAEKTRQEREKRAREEARLAREREKQARERKERAREWEVPAREQAPGVLFVGTESKVVRDKRFGPPWVLWSITGSMVIATGGMLHWQALENGRSFDREVAEFCPTGCSPQEVPELSDRLDRAETQQRVAIAAYVVGGAALTASLVWAYLDRTSRSSAEQEKSESVTVTPLAGPQELGGMVHVRF